VTILEYECYLTTGHWQHTRLRKILTDGKWSKGHNHVECERCKQFIYAKDVEVHHKHYRNVGSEDLTDLMILCKECHSDTHGKPKSLDPVAYSAAEIMEEFRRDLQIMVEQARAF
jgi:hypothetical protein